MNSAGKFFKRVGSTALNLATSGFQMSGRKQIEMGTKAAADEYRQHIRLSVEASASMGKPSLTKEGVSYAPPSASVGLQASIGESAPTNPVGTRKTTEMSVSVSSGIDLTKGEFGTPSLDATVRQVLQNDTFGLRAEQRLSTSDPKGILETAQALRKSEPVDPMLGLGLGKQTYGAFEGARGSVEIFDPYAHGRESMYTKDIFDQGKTAEQMSLLADLGSADGSSPHVELNQMLAEFESSQQKRKNSVVNSSQGTSTRLSSRQQFKEFSEKPNPTYSDFKKMM